jgi:CHAT domain-containing protein
MINMLIRNFILLFGLLSSTPVFSQDLDSMYKEVASAIALGKFTDAISISEKAVQLAKEKKGAVSNEHQIALSSLAYAYSMKGDHKPAVELLLKALGITTKLFDENHYMHLNVVFRLAEGYAQLGKIKESNQLVTKYQIAISEIEKITTLDSRSEELTNKNMFKEAETLLVEQITLAKKYFRSSHNITITALLRLAHTYRERGLNAQARQIMEEAISAYESMEPNENRPYYQATLGHLAKLYQQSGRYADAEKLLTKSLAITKQEKGEYSLNYAHTLNTLGSLYKSTHRYAEAESVLKQALEIEAKIVGQESKDFAVTLMYLAELYLYTGRAGKAESVAMKSWNILKKLYGYDEEKITILNNLASIYGKIGNYKLAFSLFQDGLKLLGTKNEELHDEAVLLFTNLGSLALETSQYSFADSCFDKAISLQRAMSREEHPDHARLLMLSAQVKLKTRELNTSKVLLNQAKNILIKSGTINNIEHVAINTSLAMLDEVNGEYASALAQLKTAETVVKASVGEIHPDFGNAMINQALLHWRMNNTELAEKYFNDGVRIFITYTQQNILFLTEEEKTKLISRNNSFVDAMLSYLQSTGSKSGVFRNQTFNHILKMKGMALFDASKALTAARKSNDVTLKQTLQKWEQNRSLLAKHYNDPKKKQFSDSLAMEVNDAAKLINQYSAHFRALGGSLRSSSTGIWHTLKHGQAAVEFVHFERYRGSFNTDSVVYAAFVITKQDSVPSFITLCGEEQLQKLLTTNNSISNQKSLSRGIISPTDSKPGKLDSIYQLIWKPLEAKLKGSKTVFISLSGLLNKLSFASLPSDDDQYLADQYRIRQYFTLSDIANANTADKYQTASAYGGVDYGSNGIKTIFNYLPGTLKEVEQIRDLFLKNSNRSEFDVKTGWSASEDNFKALSGNSPELIHLATHGYYHQPAAAENNRSTEGIDPLLRCGLALSGANTNTTDDNNDGVLTGFEIIQLDLSKTRLAVLSACETGLGDIKGSEGVYGLQRAFKIAGVDKLLISLWDVPDKETSELMTLFYQGVLSGKESHDALHEARISLRKKYAPHTWAAFVLVE